MTDAALFNKLSNGGSFILPYLIEIKNTTTTIRLTNNNNPITYNGNTYAISTFEYSEPEITGSGGSLNITCIDNELIELLENTPVNEQLTINVYKAIVDGDDVSIIKKYNHYRGSATIPENLTAAFSLQEDDRLEMQFTPYKFDTSNNKSGA